MYLLYNLFFACAALISLPWWALQMLRKGKYRAGFSERLGRVPERLKVAAQRCIWIHAVSVGEVLAVSRLITELQNAYPGTQVFISTTTATGQSLARERFGETNCFFAPLDFGFAIRPYLNALKPSLLILAETEFWPNLLRQVRQRGTPVATVNARISDRSFPRYRRFRWFFRRVLSNVDLFLAQTGADAERMRTIGAPPERVQVSGNLKFDIRPRSASGIVQQLRSVIPQESPVIVCGSTAEGEEGPVLEAFGQVQQQFLSAVLILAPRHPERFNKVADLIASSELAFIRRSSWIPACPISGGVFLLDSVGELASVYALADIAFVGGSLVATGGHNILEPAQYGCAIVVGPHTFNFREIVSIFRKGRALLEADSANGLAYVWHELLSRPEERSRMGERARQLFTQHAGATQRTLQALRPLLGKSGAVVQ